MRVVFDGFPAAARLALAWVLRIAWLTTIRSDSSGERWRRHGFVAVAQKREPATCSASRFALLRRVSGVRDRSLSMLELMLIMNA
jgi:hypothetical protein